MASQLARIQNESPRKPDVHTARFVGKIAKFRAFRERERQQRKDLRLAAVSLQRHLNNDEERGPAVTKTSQQVRTRKMIRELRRLGCRVELVSAPSGSPV
jgi:hypothetical protein